MIKEDREKFKQALELVKSTQMYQEDLKTGTDRGPVHTVYNGLQYMILIAE